MLKTKNGILLASVIVISMVMVATMPTLAKGQAVESTIFEDDFESGNLSKWNIISGDWEIIIEGDNHVAHLNRSSDWGRILVSKASIPDDAIIKAKVKGDAIGDPGADITVGFYSNDIGSGFYEINLGGGDDARTLTIAKRVNGGGGLLAENTSVVTSNNIWYNVEIKLEESNIFAKIWAVGSSEPSDWQVSYSGATPFGNYLLIGGIAGQDNEEFWFDNISVSTPTTETIISISTDKTSYNLGDVVKVTLNINRSEEEPRAMSLELELQEPCNDPDMLYQSTSFVMPAVFQSEVTLPIRIDRSMWISGGEYSIIATLRDPNTSDLIDRDTADCEIDDEMPWMKKMWINKLKKFLP
jgi:hypothetical protein